MFLHYSFSVSIIRILRRFKNHTITGVLITLFLFPIFVKSQTGSFTFTLSNSARTSAGVYKKDSTLVRTLWADRNYAAGTYTEYWDGKDDYGIKIASPDKTYNIKVLSNNVNYNWDGIIGNTSSSQTGTGVHRGYYTCMTGMAITGTTAYFCQGYSEGYASEAKFSTKSPQVRLNVFPGRISTMNADYVATDGINVYWAGYNAYSEENSFVHATKVSDDSQVSFGANGTPYTMTNLVSGQTYRSVIDKMSVANSRPSGLAVQQQGTYLFVSHGGLNQIHVLNKTSGALLQKISISKPQSLSVDGNSLWVVSGTTVAKYNVNSNGTLGTKTLTLSGIGAPGAIQVFGSTIAVIDAGSNQIVRFFNTATGAQVAQLGTIGGYASSPAVTNTKFFFSDYKGPTNSFLAFAPDGSFWVGDPGNYRALHYNSSRTFIESIMSLGSTYSSCVDPNNITRVFANYLEFAVDYSKPLTGNTGWTLVRNWGYGQESNVGLSKLLGVVTLNNGRTYGYNYNTAGLGTFVELTTTGFRKTTDPMGTICKDGSVQRATGSTNLGATVTVTKYPLAGFDKNGNPQWSSAGTLLVTSPKNTLTDPTCSPLTEVLSSSNKIIFYNDQIYYLGSTAQPFTGYHLGAIKKGTSTWLWKTQRATQRNYAGAFPEADFFEYGNGVNQYAGSCVNVIDNNIITGYHGEFWKNLQTNYYNHYLDDGLAVGQFGTDLYVSGTDPAVGNAGNALTPMVVKDANGNLYLFHGDESTHAGIHKWKISNLTSIKEQYISIPFPNAYVGPVLNYLNLHSGLPSNTRPTSNGWSISGNLQSVTGTKKYINDGAPDVLTTFSQSSGSASVQRDLGTNNVATSWKISGMLSFELSDITAGSGVISYVDVLDAAGKILARFNYTFTFSTGILTIYANSAIVAHSKDLGSTLLKFQPFEIAVLNGNVTFKYANFAPITTQIYDPAANWKKPKTLRQYFVGKIPGYPQSVGFMDMRFYKDYSASTISTDYVNDSNNADSESKASSQLITFKALSVSDMK